MFTPAILIAFDSVYENGLVETLKNNWNNQKPSESVMLVDLI